MGETPKGAIRTEPSYSCKIPKELALVELRGSGGSLILHLANSSR